MGKVLGPENYTVALGASAGGLEELYRFFENTPIDSASYIIIQHLSPDFRSRMSELLAKHSALQVKEAEDNEPIELNVVYFIPSDKFMTIRDGHLHLEDKNGVPRPHNTINIFFESLAKERGDKAIGVILSGTGDDGREGVKSIKKAGGMIIASDPVYAAHGTMPAKAIETEMVDYILVPDLMPQVIQNYIKSRSEAGEFYENDKEDEISANNIIELIRDTLPLDFSEYKKTTILRRIKRRALSLNFNNLTDYHLFLVGSPEETERLSQDFLIGVTAFFRDPEAFQFVETDIIPAIFNMNEVKEEVKVWVAGCATGEEAYSIGILIKEYIEKTGSAQTVKIFATDLDATALAFAAKGVYGMEIKKQVTPDRIEKYFIEGAGSYRIKPSIRKMLIFSHHDLIRNPPYCNMNLVSCRNLLIYLSPTLQKKVLSMLHFGLKKNGYLFLGTSENIYQPSAGLELVNKEYRVFQNVADKKPILAGDFNFQESLNLRSVSLQNSDEQTFKVKQSLAGSVNEAVMNELGYVVICVDRKNNVIQTFGDHNRFLYQKNFVTTITDLLPPPLDLAYKNASHAAIQKNGRATVKGVVINNGAQQQIVTLVIKPLLIKNDDRQLLMCIISEDQFAKTPDPAEVFDQKASYNQYTINIEEELSDVKDKLAVSYEKLGSYKENMQSFNEELIAANEELQSANEEMQSVNEELYTINTAYLLKNKELSDLNDDLNNYFRSNVNGQLFVNNDFLLMKFSPNTVRHINLKESDIGRSIADLTTNIKFNTFIEDIRHVMQHGVVTTKEIEATNGRWYQMLIMPYIRQFDEHRDGAIISFSDITELKLTQEALRRIADKREDFMNIASHELKTPLTSLKGYLQLLHEFVHRDKLSQYDTLLNKANDQTVKLAHLINNLLDAAVAGSNQMQLNIESFPLDEAIENCLESNLSRKADIQVVGKQNVELSGDQEKIEQVINNLLSNAIKYSPADSKVTVRVDEDDNYIIISISDNGIGIPADNIPHIFERFYRVTSHTTNQSGLGLGLYIAYQIVEAHKGKIEVSSKLKVGTTFNIFLPK